MTKLIIALASPFELIFCTLAGAREGAWDAICNIRAAWIEAGRSRASTQKGDDQ